MSAVHGCGGWILEQYDWDESTGIARCVYERTVKGGGTEREITQRVQPANPSHVGWSTRND